MFLNYNFYKTTRELPAVKKYKAPVVNVQIDDELENIEAVY